MLLLPDNKHMITIRDIELTGAIKITNISNKDFISLETLDVKNLMIRSAAVSSNEKLLFIAVDYPPFDPNSVILCYDLETKT